MTPRNRKLHEEDRAPPIRVWRTRLSTQLVPVKRPVSQMSIDIVSMHITLKFHPKKCSHHVLKIGRLYCPPICWSRGWRQFTLACAMVKNTVEIGSYRLQGHCKEGGPWKGPPQWSLLLCSSISNKHGGFIGKSWIKGKNSRKRWRDRKIKGHTLWMEVYGSENHRTDGNYKLGNRWTQWFILEIICNQHIIRDFPDHLWFPVFFLTKKSCGSLKAASNNILPG